MSVWSRLGFALLIVADRLLGTHLAERQLSRMQRRVDVYQAEAAAIQRQMAELNRLLHIAQVELCVLYLRQRRFLLPDTWLCFSPGKSTAEESGLNLLIDRLAKHGLAMIHTEEIGEQAYVYHVCPDWRAIVDLLSSWREHVNPLALTWLEEVRLR